MDYGPDRYELPDVLFGQKR